MKCKECDSRHIVKSGFVLTRKGKTQRYKCQDCGYTFQLKRNSK